MNKHWKLFTIVTVLVAAMAFAGVTAVFAQGPNQPAAPGAGNQAQVGGGMGYRAVEEADMHAAVAAALGISEDELEAEIAAGKTVYLLAQELGVDFAVVQAAMDAVHEAAMQQAAADGTITQAQANQVQQMRNGRSGQANGGSSTGSGPAAGSGPANRGGGSGECLYPAP